MAPRTFQWPKRESSLPNDTSNIVALVLENSEVFESEAAELTIEEADDYSSSLLLRNDWPSTDNILPDLTPTNRNSSITHSAHSLATTSVVTSTQHAQIVEFSLLSLPATLSSTENYLSNLKISGAQAPSQADYQTYQNHKISSPELTLSASDILDKIDSFMSSCPIHIVDLANPASDSCPPSSWPHYLLAHTDVPALVQVIQKDMNNFWSHLSNTHYSESRPIPVLPCDEASDLTTCQLTCCEADVEVLDCNNILGSVTSTNITTTTSTSANHSDAADNETVLGNSNTTTSPTDKRRNVHKRPRSRDNPFVLGYNETCLQPLDSGRIFLASYSGIQPGLGGYDPIKPHNFTAVYLLLVPDSCISSFSESLSTTSINTVNAVSSKRLCLSLEHEFPVYSELDESSHNHTSNDKNQNPNQMTFFAILSQLVPSFHYSGLCKRPIHLNHSILESDLVRLHATCAIHQYFTALIALVDLVPVYDDLGMVRPKVIIHQRLHYAPELNFRIQPCS